MEGLIAALGGLVHFTVWSFAVPAAIVSGYWVALRRAREAGVELRTFESSMEWGIGGGLLLSHMAEILFYQPQKLRAEGVLTLFKFWDGLSSYGGFFGGVLVFALYYRIVTRRSWWKEADLLIQGMVVAWIFGRFGCTVSGDHPGPRTSVWWAYPYPYPDGPRHNMGLYELLFTILVLLPANLLLRRRKPPVGAFVAMNCLLYGAGRFALDFLRSKDQRDSDPRYGGLTLAHYCSLGIFLFGALVAVLSKRGALAARSASASTSDGPSPSSSSPASPR